MGAYGLVSQGRLDAASLRYQTVNALGAGLLAVSAFSADNWPSLVSNLVWALIALLSLFRKPRTTARAFVVRMRILCAQTEALYERTVSLRPGMGRPSERLTS
jgi:hypothetical protein